MKNTKKIAVLLAAQMIFSAIPAITGIQSDSALPNTAYAETVGITGTLKPGYTLTAPSGTTYQWYQCDTQDSEGTLNRRCNSTDLHNSQCRRREIS